MIAWNCPGCQQRLQVGDGGAGKRVKCPRCGRTLPVPTPAAVIASESPTLASQAAPAAASGPETVAGADGGTPDATRAGQGRPRSPAAAVPPDLVNHPRYRVLALLGQGGMGAVYKAEHKRMERAVALKVVSPALVESPPAVRRFHQEVKAAARLHHPNIITAYDADQAGPLHFLVMEFVEGESLADTLRQRGPLPAAEACDYVRQAALGLQHAHEQGMVHRDIKPHNLMRTPQGQIKILDFGLARLAPTPETAGESQLTGAGVIMGTADYIAPEQAHDAHNADIRADVYSLGCTLYQLLTGRVPFPGGSSIDKIIQHSVGRPAALETLCPDLPRGLAAATAKMMAKDPADRYQTPADVAVALAPLTTSASATETFQARPARAPAQARRRGWRKWLVAAAALAILSAAAAAGVAVYRIATDEGELVITPESPDVEVIVSENGKQVEIVDTKTTKRVKLPSGVYDLSLKDDPDGLKLTADRITIRRGDEVLATVQFLPKKIAKVDPAPPKADPNVLVVAADGSGRFKSVREALVEAKNGMTVRIKPGTYKEDAPVLHADVEMVGDGPPGGVVIETNPSEGWHGFSVLAGKVVLRNLTIRAQTGNALTIEKGEVTAEDCTFVSLNTDHNGYPSVWIVSPQTVHLTRCTVHGNPENCGVDLLDKSQAILEDCDIADNNYQGVWVGEGASATIRKCRIHDGKRNGVYVDGKARVVIEDCELNGNAWNGVAADNTSSVTVRKSRLNRNLVSGAFAMADSTIALEDCETSDNGEGPTSTEDHGKIKQVRPAKPK